MPGVSWRCWGGWARRAGSCAAYVCRFLDDECGKKMKRRRYDCSLLCSSLVLAMVAVTVTGNFPPIDLSVLFSSLIFSILGRSMVT